ncbi:RusA family crossover junction endodeoxyribonuclease [Chryseobacterium sp. JV274]|uniref:RusA family crossover junction endodeoxyribonuclease n=1 Tax=Chryseobacterium sp. JV274 TaxID=1932669 RepID=UPI000986CACC|nr:RusA family crossover junction endodeoxyribonuclease [Chryseobacterium sp. JV274]
MKIALKILGTPQPKQSTRFKVQKFGSKQFAKAYQPAKVIQNERNIAFDVKSQLPKGFIPFTTAIKAKVTFVFPPLKSWNKKIQEQFETGEKIYKTSRPDLTDNLMKGTMDAMTGIVYTDDAVIVKVESEKIYGKVPRIEIEFEEL